MDRQWFFDSGTYDTEMGFWGTENVEMSIRLWTCGGRILRSLSPFSLPPHLHQSPSIPHRYF